MIYGYYPDFYEIMQFIKELEARINAAQHCNRVRNTADDCFSAAILAIITILPYGFYGL